MARNHKFATGEKYHIYNRGTEKRKIFLCDKDYERLLFMMCEFNKVEPEHNGSRTFERKSDGVSMEKRKKYDPLVEVENYSLMPNHFHFVIEQLEENGISKFLQKVMTGYTMYFNKKYERTGVLLQGKSKSRHINSDRYYNQLKIYLDLNPVDLCEKDWKESGKVKSIKNTMKFLKDYKWSSCKNYDSYKGYLDGTKELLYFDDLF